MKKTFLVAWAVLFVHIAIASISAAPLEPRDLIVSRNVIAATDASYRYIWIVDRKSRQVRVAFDVSSDPISTTFDKDFANFRIPAIQFLSFMDPKTQWEPGQPLKEKPRGWFWSLRDRLPYAGCSEALCPVLRPKGIPDGAWTRIVSYLGLGLPPKDTVRTVLFDAGQMRVVFGSADARSPNQEFKHITIKSDPSMPTGSLGGIEDQSDVLQTNRSDRVPQPVPGVIYLPIFRDGLPGIAVVRTGGHDPSVDSFLLEGKGIGTRGSVSPDGKRIYLVFEDLWVIDLERKRLVARKPLGMYAIAAKTSEDGRELYVQGATENVIQVWDADKLEKIDEIKLPVPSRRQ